MGGSRQKKQLELAFPAEAQGEAPATATKGTEPPMANRETERPAAPQPTIEEVLNPENLKEALKRVRRNAGSPGVDGMTVEKLPGYLAKRWPAIREQLVQGTYKPKPVKRVEIQKPSGGTRKLGIPTLRS